MYYVVLMEGPESDNPVMGIYNGPARALKEMTRLAHSFAKADERTVDVVQENDNIMFSVGDYTFSTHEATVSEPAKGVWE